MAVIRLFRLTNAGDTDATEFIDFNVPGTEDDTKKEHGFITSIKENDTDGVGSNQGVETPLGDQQALDKVEDVITIDGFFSKRDGNNDDGQNTLIILMRTFAAQPKLTDDWDLGRFGLRVDDDVSQSVIPDGAGVPADLTIALLWARIEWETDFTGNREKFKLVFRVNKGDGA